MDDIPHLIADRYSIEGEIGRGGMGTVYRAMHLGLGRPVAVKVLNRDCAAATEIADRLRREARTMALLHRKGVPIIYDVDRLPDGRPFIVMEYVEGVTLADKLAEKEHLPLQRAVEIACEIFDVLAEAHELGIVHRDLKPSNIMLTKSGVCLLDFGIAKVIANSPEITRTHTPTKSGLIFGTPRYMSPEQRLGSPAEATSDIYSVGVILFEMLVGRPPATNHLPKIVTNPRHPATLPPSLIAKCRVVPRRLKLVVNALLAEESADRPQSAQEARQRLLNVRVQRGAHVWQLTAAVVVLLAALVGGWLVLRPQPSQQARVIPRITPSPISVPQPSPAPSNTPTPDAPSRPETDSDRVKIGKGQIRNVPPSATPAVTPLMEDKGYRPAKVPLLSDERALEIAGKLVHHGVVSEAHFLRINGVSYIVALHDEQGAPGRFTHLFLMEWRKKAGDLCVPVETGFYCDTAREVPLDVRDNLHNDVYARWTSEESVISGCPGVLFVGEKKRRKDEPVRIRLVFFDPVTKQSYGLRAERAIGRRNSPHVKEMENAQSKNAQPFHDYLASYAFEILRGTGTTASARRNGSGASGSKSPVHSSLAVR